MGTSGSHESNSETGVIITPVTDTITAEIARSIRNATRGTYTVENTEISREQQVVFFNNYIKTNRAKLFLYGYDTDRYAAFGMVRWVDDKDRRRSLWATLGVLPEHQNKGLGQFIYQDLYHRAQEFYQPLWLEIWGDNNASLISALRAGFEVHSVIDAKVVLIKE